MVIFDRSRRKTVVLVIILLVAAVLRLGIAWQPVQTLLRVNLPDDAFYYFVIARNIVNGDGATLDGINVNNGFHPLWLLLMLALPWRCVTLDLPVHLALSLGALLDVGACYLLYRVTMRLTGKSEAGLICAAFYAFNVVAVLQSTNGLETALAGVLAIGSWLGVLELSSRPTIGQALAWGVVVGLVLLARTDNVLLVVCLCVYLFARRHDRAIWIVVTVAVVGSIIVISPWLIWNQVHFGSPMQVSGIAVPYAIHARYQMIYGNNAWFWARGALEKLLDKSLWLRGDFTGTPPFVGPALWSVGAVGLIMTWKSGKRAILLAWLPIALAATGLVLVHTLLRWYPRPWYFMPSAHALSVGWGIGVTELAAAWRGWRRLALIAGLVAVSVVSIWSSLAVWRIGLYPWQDRMMEAARWIMRHVPEGEMVGSLNAGIYAYYSERTVVNLDGVVNPAAFAAVREKRLLAYMQEAGIRYFVDFDHALDKEYGVFMGSGYLDGLQPIEVAASSPYPTLGSLWAYQVVHP